MSIVNVVNFKFGILPVRIDSNVWFPHSIVVHMVWWSVSISLILKAFVMSIIGSKKWHDTVQEILQSFSLEQKLIYNPDEWSPIRWWKSMQSSRNWHISKPVRKQMRILRNALLTSHEYWLNIPIKSNWLIRQNYPFIQTLTWRRNRWRAEVVLATRHVWYKWTRNSLKYRCSLANAFIHDFSVLLIWEWFHCI